MSNIDFLHETATRCARKKVSELKVAAYADEILANHGLTRDDVIEMVKQNRTEDEALAGIINKSSGTLDGFNNTRFRCGLSQLYPDQTLEQINDAVTDTAHLCILSDILLEVKALAEGKQTVENACKNIDINTRFLIDEYEKKRMD